MEPIRFKRTCPTCEKEYPLDQEMEVSAVDGPIRRISSAFQEDPLHKICNACFAKGTVKGKDLGPMDG